MRTNAKPSGNEAAKVMTMKVKPTWISPCSSDQNARRLFLIDRMRTVNRIAAAQGAPAVESAKALMDGSSRSSPGSGLDLRFMPAVNATLNGLSACLLATGWWAIRRKRWKAHRALMLSAFASSALFLVGYLAYHFIHGDTHYAGEGPLKVVYLAVLASHVLLSMGIVPAAFALHVGELAAGFGAVAGGHCHRVGIQHAREVAHIGRVAGGACPGGMHHHQTGRMHAHFPETNR